jgi:hypothetical protein
MSVFSSSNSVRFKLKLNLSQTNYRSSYANLIFGFRNYRPDLIDMGFEV